MKKHQLAATVGTLALVANLLLPNLAFGQNQQANQAVGCPGAGTQEFSHVPADTTLTALTAGTGGNTVDSTIIGTSQVPGVNLLAISDLTSGGANGCTTVGGSVTASATSFENAVGDTIDAGKLRLVTTTNVDSGDGTYGTVFGASPVTTDANVTYDRASGPGDSHDVTAPQAVADKDTATLSTTANVTAYTLSDPAQNTFGSGAAVDVLRYCTPKNSVFGTGVALALENVPASQASGNYTATVTYTKSPLNCVGASAGTLGATMFSGNGATTMTMSDIDALGLEAQVVGNVYSVGAEYVTVTAHTDGEATYTVARAQLGTTAVAHNVATIVYRAATMYAAALDGNVDGGAVTTFTTLDNTQYQVGQTLVLNDAGYEHVRVTSISATNGFDITVQRGTDGTNAVSHNAGTDIYALYIMPS